MIETSMGNLEFEADLRAYSKAIKRTYVTALKRTINFLSNQIIDRSPYDTGKFIASNNISFNFVDDSIYVGPKTTKGEAKAIAKKQQLKIKNLDQDVVDNLTTVWLSNNQPYANMLEYGLYQPGPKIVAGYSKKSPQGIYRLSVQATENRIKDFIKKAEDEHLKE